MNIKQNYHLINLSCLLYFEIYLLATNKIWVECNKKNLLQNTLKKIHKTYYFTLTALNGPFDWKNNIFLKSSRDNFEFTFKKSTTTSTASIWFYKLWRAVYVKAATKLFINLQTECFL